METEFDNITTGPRINTDAVCDILKSSNLSEVGITVAISNDWSKDKEKIEVSKDSADYFSDFMSYIYAKNGNYETTPQTLCDAEDHVSAGYISELLLMSPDYKGKKINILEVRAWYNPDRIENVVRMIFYTTKTN